MSYKWLSGVNGSPEENGGRKAGMPGVVTWGVIGGGDSAWRFTAGLRYVTGAKLTSVWTIPYRAKIRYRSSWISNQIKLKRVHLIDACHVQIF
jgi:hypothetical protein